VAIALLVLLPVVAGGCIECTWQANSGSQAVTVPPFEGLRPADGPGYMNGMPQDMRERR
jgi:hypothetical protein